MNGGESPPEVRGAVTADAHDRERRPPGEGETVACDTPVFL